MTLDRQALRTQPDTSGEEAASPVSGVGYTTRVSSLDQNQDRQLEGIQLDETFADSVSAPAAVDGAA